MKPIEIIEEEICHYFDGCLEEHLQKDFESRLFSDPEAMDLLCFHALMDASLRRIPQVQNLATEISVKRQRRRAVRISLAVAAMLVLGTALILQQFMATGQERLATFETSPGTVFSLRAKDDSTQDNLLDPGETLVISQGLAEITLADGSRCVAEAPAQLTLKSKGHMHLSGGRAFFEIAKGSEGFVVTTKDLEIIDLGTAFAIDDRETFQPQIHVMKGKVRATTLSGRRETMDLAVGEAVRVGAAGTLRPIVSEGSKFFQDLPSDLPAIAFSFEKKNDGALAADGAIAIHNNVQIFPKEEIPGLRSVTGIHGHGLGFSKSGHALETNWFGIDGAVPRTISFWIRIPEDSHGGRILGWGLDSGGRAMSDIAVVYSGENLANLRLASGRRWLQSTARLDTGKWHHIAFVTETPEDGEWPVVKCYLDGQPEPVTKRVSEAGAVGSLDSFETVTKHPDSRPLSFGSLRFKLGQRHFSGELDELVITAGILTESQIRKLAE